MKVYLVTNEWASDDSCGTAIEVCGTYEKALKIYNQWITEERSECWDVVFDGNGELTEGYEIDQGDDFWEIWEDGYYVSNHTRITIQSKEVQ